MESIDILKLADLLLPRLLINCQKLSLLQSLSGRHYLSCEVVT